MMRSRERNERMKKIILGWVLAAGGICLADPAAVPLEQEWRNGFRLHSADDSFILRPRVLVQFDLSTYSEEDLDESATVAAEADSESADQLEGGSEIRRARLGFEGMLHGHLGYEAVFDLSGGDVQPVDVFVALLELPVLGTLRVGHQREPVSRLQGGSANYIFMEKGAQDTLAPDRNLGIRALRSVANGRMTWSAGAYQDTDKTGASTDDDAYDLAARVTGLPWYEKESGRLLHVGLAYAYRRPPADALDFSAGPESHQAEPVVGLEEVSADQVDLLAGEAALILGPVSFLGEYLVTELESGEVFDGYQATASWILTGETRGYDTEEGKLGGVKPRRNYDGPRGGPGAWEVAFRLSGLDLRDGAVDEGRLEDATLAVNWYLNPNVKMQMNYIRADADEQGEADILQGRLQLNF